MDIRREFLDFFKSKDHQEYDSMSLVPNDPTLLFTNAGMVQFKDIFTAQKPTPKIPRGTSCQLCVRAGGKHNDLDNIGYTRRHQTLFEMLGNFSFGDYFKEGAIDNAYEFLTSNLEFKKDDLYISVHEKDEEALKIWQKYISQTHIKKFGDKDNLWQMGDVGPWGYCSEIFIDQGDKHFKDKEDYFGGEGDRFLEIWNLVFMQFEAKENGENIPLPKPSIDTGMGLERVVALKEGKLSNFDTSLFMPTINRVEELLAQKYSYEKGASFRVVADHIRSISFLIAHGVNFDKEGRGYVLRRILRRAVRHGYLLGFKEPFLYKLVDELVATMGHHYLEIKENQSYIKQQIMEEETRFFSTIFDGMKIFEKELSLTHSNKFSGEVAFKLYDTYGFPLDLTEDMLKEKKIEVDKNSFDGLMQKQKEMARAAWKGSGDANLNKNDVLSFSERIDKKQFVGYENLDFETEIISLFDTNMNKVEHLNSKTEGYALFKNTPFYARSGGQEGDTGLVHIDNKVVCKVTDTVKIEDINISKIEVTEELNKKNIEKVLLSVDKFKRREISRHHSSVHVLHRVLVENYENVKQAGSYVSHDKMRFDFTINRALNEDELRYIEQEVNRRVLEFEETNTEIMAINEAKKSGAVAAFDDKYGDFVRVVNIGDSKEFCGGTHVKNIGEIGSFYITKESSVSSGVRRLECVASLAAVDYSLDNKYEIENARRTLKSSNIVEGIEKLEKKVKDLKKNKNKSGTSTIDLNSLPKDKINDTDIFVLEIENHEIDLKITVDEMKNRYENLVVVIFRKNENGVSIVTGSKGNDIKSNLLLSEVAKVLDGRGGGRADFAQGAGKDSSNIEKAKEMAKKYIKSNF